VVKTSTWWKGYFAMDQRSRTRRVREKRDAVEDGTSMSAQGRHDMDIIKRALLEHFLIKLYHTRRD
jgi:hypothetical protein